MSIQGISCPRCGSRRIAIVVSDALTFKCLDCGYTWSPNLPAQGLVHTRSGDVHWTEVKKIMEDAINYVIGLLSGGLISCNDVINKVQEKYGNYLSSREILRVIINGTKKYLEEIRYKDANKYSVLATELSKCKELISKRE
ncbi:hypothetical protein [Vulcanisaeta sp. JCM 16159]|uniref:hypothetical protein n=1 Tax=Vulcanisaeta sp. JCM 16159 TaxID=1295371 RepID=UPI0006D225B1|nr:hypothetical protein [Vulcanisaeta sp. JCM 16159]